VLFRSCGMVLLGLFAGGVDKSAAGICNPVIPAFSGLLSCWDGDAVSGSTATGAIPGSMNGRVMAVPGSTVGWSEGGAFSFDGETGYINMGNMSAPNVGTNPLTLEAWFN